MRHENKIFLYYKNFANILKAVCARFFLIIWRFFSSIGNFHTTFLLNQFGGLFSKKARLRHYQNFFDKWKFGQKRYWHSFLKKKNLTNFFHLFFLWLEGINSKRKSRKIKTIVITKFHKIRWRKIYFVIFS